MESDENKHNGIPMKIVLPKTLAEPGTIPWVLISSDLPYMVIRKALQRFGEQVRGEIAAGNRSHNSLLSRVSIETNLRIVAKQNKGIDVWTSYRRLFVGSDKMESMPVGTIYEVYYKTKKDGPEYSTVLLIKSP